MITRATDSTILARWPIDEVVVVGDAEHEAVPVLARRRHDARLVIEDHETRRKLVDMVPQFAALIGVKPAPSRRIATFGGALTAAIALLWLGIDWGSGHAAAFVPHRMQAKLGHAVLGELVQTKDLCQGEAGLRAVRELANRLARASDYTHPVEVYVVKGGPINAYTLPGGILVFYSDLIDRAKDGTQVAGVLAHEIGHVVHNHPMKGLVRQFGVEIVARALTGGFSEIGTLASGGGLLLALRNGRRFEREADATAVELLEAIGVRADGVASFFEQLLEREQHDTAEAVGIWSSHPPTRERIAATRRPATGRPPFSDVEWKALRDVCK
ncbi:MAG: M48 family metallopeptidase [Enhydrobacter sp.]|nr:MAG: M48 family metallopeptidase [Enhydrobacter sp.]